MKRNLVGSRELKARLGTYLREVRRGRTLVVTDRGEPVAELRPIAATGAAAALAKLKARGIVTQLSEGPLPPFRPIDNKGPSVSSAIVEDREDRL